MRAPSSLRLQVVVAGLFVFAMALAIVTIGGESNLISGKQYAPSNPTTPAGGGGSGLDTSTQRCYAYGDKLAGGDNQKLVPGANISYYGPSIATILNRLRAGEEFEYVSGPVYTEGQRGEPILGGQPQRSIAIESYSMNMTFPNGQSSDVTVTGLYRSFSVPSDVRGLSLHFLPLDDFADSTFKIGPYSVKDIIFSLDEGRDFSLSNQDQGGEGLSNSPASRYEHTEYYCKTDRLAVQFYSGNGKEERGKVTNLHELETIYFALEDAVIRKNFHYPRNIHFDRQDDELAYYVIPV